MPVTRHHGSNQHPHHMGHSARQHFEQLSQQSHQPTPTRVSPTLKGALIGAVAGRLVPLKGLGTFSGALLGGIAGKWLDSRQAQQQLKPQR